MDMADLIKVSTASRIMGVTSQYIYTLIDDKRLKVTKIDGVAFVSKKEVEALQADRESQKH